jgi:dTDP-4-amino-4,6-dideoxygalactose transaminase
VNIQRTIPPTAAPISLMDLVHGFRGIMNRKFPASLENEMKEYFGMKHVFLVSSGKAALFMILSGLKRLSGKKKVILPAYTCFSVPSSIRMAGLDIVLCDIRPETLDYDFSQLKKLVDDETLCILSTHLFGIPSDVAKIRSLTGDKRIFIVEDAAQAMGGVLDGHKLGTLGDVAFFSLGRGKNISCGSGGVIITSAEDIADSIREDYVDLKKVPMIEYIKNIVEIVFMMFFLRPDFYWLPKNLSFLKIGETRFYWTFPVRKLTGFQAGLLYDWRQKLETLNRSRAGNADGYIESLELSNGLQIHANGFPYNRFPIYLEGKASKEELCESGNRMGISPMYPFPIHRIQEIKEIFDRRDFKGAETISDTLVTLPTHILLNEKDKLMIREAVKKVLRQEQRNEHTFRQGSGCH